MPRPDYIIRGDVITTTLCKKDDRLLTGLEDGNIKVYDTEIMRPTATWLAHKEAQVLNIASTKSGVLSQGRDGTICLWKDGTCAKKCSVGSTGFCSFALSSDDRHCFVGLDEDSKICCVDVNSFEVVRTFQPSDHNKKGMSWSLAADERLIFVGYESGDLVLFDKRFLRNQVSEHKLHDEIITAIDVSGDTIITASPDNTIKITTLSGLPSPTNEQRSESESAPLSPSATVSHTIPLEAKSASRVKVREDKKLFAAAGWDGGLRLYSCKKYKLLALIAAHDPDSITDMIMYDNRIVCSGRDKKISFWTLY